MACSTCNCTTFIFRKLHSNGIKCAECKVTPNIEDAIEIISSNKKFLCDCEDPYAVNSMIDGFYFCVGCDRFLHKFALLKDTKPNQYTDFLTAPLNENELENTILINKVQIKKIRVKKVRSILKTSNSSKSRSSSKASKSVSFNPYRTIFRFKNTEDRSTIWKPYCSGKGKCSTAISYLDEQTDMILCKNCMCEID